MGKKYKHLFDKIVDANNFWNAYFKAANRKRLSRGYLVFRHNEAVNLSRLINVVKSGDYKVPNGRKFVIFEPKPREIEAIPFEDRVIQHAINNIISPIFEKIFLHQSYACRINKGTHKAAIRLQSLLRKNPDCWVLKTDFSKYFKSIDREILYQEIERKIKCIKTIKLLKNIIPDKGKGIPIGSLISQLFANIYGHIIDRWLAHQEGISDFVRYMDDIVIIGKDKESLTNLKDKMEKFVQTEMKLGFSKWYVRPSKIGVNFCGYRIWNTHKLLRKSSINRAKRKIRKYRNNKDDESLRKFLASWTGHIKWADSYNLSKRLGLI